MECTVCFHPYTETDRAPKILQCGHTYCYQCCLNLVQQREETAGQDEETPVIVCPMCRTHSLITQVRNNYALAEILAANAEQAAKANAAGGTSQKQNETDGGSGSSSGGQQQQLLLLQQQNQLQPNNTLQDATFCTEHVNEQVDTFCLTCEKFICRYCYQSSNSFHGKHDRCTPVQLRDQLLTTLSTKIQKLEQTRRKKTTALQNWEEKQEQSYEICKQSGLFYFEQLMFEITKQRTKFLQLMQNASSVMNSRLREQQLSIDLLSGDYHEMVRLDQELKNVVMLSSSGSAGQGGSSSSSSANVNTNMQNEDQKVIKAIGKYLEHHMLLQQRTQSREVSGRDVVYGGASTTTAGRINAVGVGGQVSSTPGFTLRDLLHSSEDDINLQDQNENSAEDDLNLASSIARLGYPSSGSMLNASPSRGENQTSSAMRTSTSSDQRERSRRRSSGELELQQRETTEMAISDLSFVPLVRIPLENDLFRVDEREQHATGVVNQRQGQVYQQQVPGTTPQQHAGQVSSPSVQGIQHQIQQQQQQQSPSSFQQQQQQFYQQQQQQPSNIPSNTNYTSAAAALNNQLRNITAMGTSPTSAQPPPGSASSSSSGSGPVGTFQHPASRTVPPPSPGTMRGGYFTGITGPSGAPGGSIQSQQFFANSNTNQQQQNVGGFGGVVAPGGGNINNSYTGINIGSSAPAPGPSFRYPGLNPPASNLLNGNDNDINYTVNQRLFSATYGTGIRAGVPPGTTTGVLAGNINPLAVTRTNATVESQSLSQQSGSSFGALGGGVGAGNEQDFQADSPSRRLSFANIAASPSRFGNPNQQLNGGGVGDQQQWR
ncbi:unnamed protein product [Amoebophrya sp. A120]|nr:unnamed protein product [Amoebophrya sp. A120]|eukprot:GSA120T00013791001.1